jgi:hypothetical protein
MGYKAKPEFIGESLRAAVSAKAGGESSIRELNVAKWKSGEIQSEQPSPEEGLSPFEEPTEQEQGIKI